MKHKKAWKKNTTYGTYIIEWYDPILQKVLTIEHTGTYLSARYALFSIMQSGQNESVTLKIKRKIKEESDHISDELRDSYQQSLPGIKRNPDD